MRHTTAREQKRWAYRCYKQLIAKGINFEEKATFLCGKEYYEYLARLFPVNEIPLKNVMGIASQEKMLQGAIECLLSESA